MIKVLSVHGAGVTSQGEEVFLRDVWPSREEVMRIEEDAVIAAIFRELKERSKVRAPSVLRPVPGSFNLKVSVVLPALLSVSAWKRRRTVSRQ